MHQTPTALQQNGPHHRVGAFVALIMITSFTINVCRFPAGYPIEPPLCHCLTPLHHPNILNPPPTTAGAAGPALREQNVCCSYLHGSTFADPGAKEPAAHPFPRLSLCFRLQKTHGRFSLRAAEVGYDPTMPAWRVVWAVCLLLHRYDTEGLGVFTVSNPLDGPARTAPPPELLTPPRPPRRLLGWPADSRLPTPRPASAASQFMNAEPEFVAEAAECTRRHATPTGQDTLLADRAAEHRFYPPAGYAAAAAAQAAGLAPLGAPSRPPAGEGGGGGRAKLVHHRAAGPSARSECAVLHVPLELPDYVEYRCMPSGLWCAAPVCAEVVGELPQSS